MKKHHRFNLRLDRPGPDGVYPIMMIITKNRKRQFVSLKISARPEQWDAINECFIIDENCKRKKEKEANNEKKQHNTTIEDFRKRALTIEFEFHRNNDSEWTLNQYKEKLLSQPTLGKIAPYLEKHILSLKETNHHSTSRHDSKLLNKLSLFDLGFINRRFSEIDYSYVNEFNIWMEKAGLSNNTRVCYLKRLSAIFNKAIKSKQANTSNYPFGRDGFIISALATETRKRYMPTEYLEKLKSQQANTPQKEYARQLFLLSYYCYGMSFKDMALLKNSNIVEHNGGKYIVYKRLKTQEKNAKPINIKITDTIRLLIRSLTDYKKPLDDFMLPIVSKSKGTSEQVYTHINTALGLYNKYLKGLAKEFGFGMELSSYVSRHTAAMQLQQKGVAEHIISQMLGHKRLETTKVYLDSLDTSVIDQAVKVL